MLAWILEYAGLSPGFLVGGVPGNFGISARLGGSKYFVVEADEYDTAFFDKRAKFVHYRPRTLVINNIEYDHADIYPSVESIIWQFHQLLRTVPSNGLVIANGKDDNIERVVARGLWTPLVTFSAAERAARWFGAYDSIGVESRFTLFEQGAALGQGRWALLGQHNLENALAAIAAAAHVGVAPAVALAALAEFKGVKRRLELRGTFGGITLYEDFAHHPTAIATTLAGLRSLAPKQRIVAVMEPRSNTMRMGVHRDTLAPSFAIANRVFMLAAADLGWDPGAVLASLGERLVVATDVQALLARLLADLNPGDHVVLMSNGSFHGLPELLERALASRATRA
jgi:UDP-N-acetylmuramate: L-alanyl-gamma-D-glutamyl-meso-diaminopimelate ligase